MTYAGHLKSKNAIHPSSIPCAGYTKPRNTEIKVKSSFRSLLLLGGRSGGNTASALMKDQLSNQFKRNEPSGYISPGLPETAPVLALDDPYSKKPLSVGQARTIWSPFLEEISFSSRIYKYLQAVGKRNLGHLFQPHILPLASNLRPCPLPDVFLREKTFVRP